MILFQIYDNNGNKVFDLFHSKKAAEYMINNYLNNENFIIEVEIER